MEYSYKNLQGKRKKRKKERKKERKTKKNHMGFL